MKKVVSFGVMFLFAACDGQGFASPDINVSNEQEQGDTCVDVRDKSLVNCRDGSIPIKCGGEIVRFEQATCSELEQASCLLPDVCELPEEE